MPELVYGQNTMYGSSLTAGRYIARFIGTADREPMDGSKFNKGPQPRMAWLFEVIEGPKTGEKFEQLTGTAASARTGCARMVAALAGAELVPGQPINTDKFIGRVYVAKIAVNPDSDKGNLFVADLEPRPGDGAGTAPTRPASAGGPPPRQPAAVPPKADAKYWIDSGDGTEKQGTGEEVRAFIFQKGCKASDLMLCPDGGSEWQPASKFGFEDSPIPA